MAEILCQMRFDALSMERPRVEWHEAERTRTRIVWTERHTARDGTIRADRAGLSRRLLNRLRCDQMIYEYAWLQPDTEPVEGGTGFRSGAALIAARLREDMLRAQCNAEELFRLAYSPPQE